MAHLAASELFSVKDMVFVITGGGTGIILNPVFMLHNKVINTGIGAMMAKALDANHAAKIYIIGRRVEKLQEVVASAVCASPPFPCQTQSKRILAQQVHHPTSRGHNLERITFSVSSED